VVAVSRGRREGGQAFFTIKPASKPGKGGRGKRATWKLCRREPDGTFVTLTIPEMDAINRGYTAGVFTWETTYDMVRALRERLYRDRDREAGKRVFNQENHKVLADYWETEYANRVLVDRDTMLWDFRRSVDAVGQLPLLTSSREELQKAVDLKFKGKPNLQRRAVDRLNSLLKHYGRQNARLRKQKEAFEELSYLRPAEFEQVAANISKKLSPFRIMCGVAMYTGMRLGEISALTEDFVSERAIRVNYQVDDDGVRRQTKNRKNRTVFVLPDGWKWIRAWLALSEDERRRARFEGRAAQKFRAACRRTFGTRKKEGRFWRKYEMPDRRRDCCFHDLRHSYAVALAQRGASLTLVAQSIGDTVRVAEKYYSGFILQEEGLDTLEKLFGTAR
jgi:integrase